MSFNITKDESKKTVTIEHPNLGAVVLNQHLKNIISEPISDTEEISEPGYGGARVVKNKVDTARKISVEVATGSIGELFLRRTLRFKKTPFTLQWLDASNSLIEIQGGDARECFTKDVANNRNADTITFEIMSMVYSGD